MNGLIVLAQAAAETPDNADVVLSWVIVILILSVGVSMSIGAIRKWWLRHQSTRATRYHSVNQRQLVADGYQAPIQAQPRAAKPVSTPRPAPSTAYQYPVAERQAPAAQVERAVKAPEIAALQVLSLPALARIFQKTPHMAVLGKTNAGKTTMAEAMIRMMDGELAIIDPKWKKMTPPKWGGLPAAAIDDDASYTTINTMLDQLWVVFRNRIVTSKMQDVTFDPLLIVWDEINDVIEELPEQAKRLRRFARLAREYNVKLMIFPQSDRVKALGLEGHGDARENFLWLYLGDDARAEAKKLVNNKQMSQEDYDNFITSEWPAIMEHTGEWFIVDRSTVLEVNQYPVSPRRAWFPDRSSGSGGEMIEVPSVGTRELEQSGTREPVEPLTDMQRKVIIAALKGGAFKSHIAKSLTGRYADLLIQIEEIAQQEGITKE